MTLRSLLPPDPSVHSGALAADAASAGRLRPQDIGAAGRRLRAALAHDLSSPHFELIAQACQRAAACAVPRITARGEFSAPLLAASLDALVRPFLNVAELQSFAHALPRRRELVGFVMPANVPGAGLHELVATLLAGCAAIVKTATREPVFFDELTQALGHLEGRRHPSLGARVAIFNWDRTRRDLTEALERSCDRMVVLGSDDTLARLRTVTHNHTHAGGETPLAGFGSRASAAVVMREFAADDALHADLADALARDVSLFDQRGCLSPLHIFIEDNDSARTAVFAARLADAMDRFAAAMPPPSSLALEDAAAIRRARESARWRALGGEPVQLWESAKLAWTVIYDRDAEFSISPGFRTVYVSPFTNLPDLERRLAPVRGRLEACALAAKDERTTPIRVLLERAGVSYVSEPGRMQSPPVDWPHGGGAFLRMLMGGDA